MRYEAALLAFCSLNTSLFKFIPYDDMEVEPALLDIYKKLSERHEAIPKEILVAEVLKINLHDTSIIDEIYASVDSILRNKSMLSTSNDFFASLIREIKYTAYKRSVVFDLEKAIEMVTNNKVTEGIIYAKKIRIATEKKVNNATDYLMESLNPDNTFSSGIKDFDLTSGGFLKGGISCIAGGSGTLKTRFSLWLIINTLVNNPSFTGIYFEKEMPLTDLARMIVSNLIKVNIRKLSVPEKEDIMLLNDYKEMLRNVMEDKNNIYIDALSRLKLIPSDMFSNAKDMYELVEKEKPSIGVLDFMTMLGDKKSDFYLNMASEVEMIKEITQANDMHMIILNQLKHNTVHSRDNKIPRISDIEYGSKMEQLSTDLWVLFYPAKHYSEPVIYNNIASDEKYFFVLGKKHRNSPPGSIAPFFCYPATTAFKEMNPEEKERAIKWIKLYDKNNKS